MSSKRFLVRPSNSLDKSSVERIALYSEEKYKEIFENNLSIKDYNRFVEIGKKLTEPGEEHIYSWLAEGFYLRLEEIAEKEGNYDFVKDGEF